MTNPNNVSKLSAGLYDVPVYRISENGLQDAGVHRITFVKGTKDNLTDFTQEGTITESLLAVCADYLKEVNSGHLSNEETAKAIVHIEEAIALLNKRTADRIKRGVQATIEK